MQFHNSVQTQAKGCYLLAAASHQRKQLHRDLGNAGKRPDKVRNKQKNNKSRLMLCSQHRAAVAHCHAAAGGERCAEPGARGCLVQLVYFS